jgi:hypothetical protein
MRSKILVGVLFLLAVSTAGRRFECFNSPCSINTSGSEKARISIACYDPNYTEAFSDRSKAYAY